MIDTTFVEEAEAVVLTMRTSRCFISAACAVLLTSEHLVQAFSSMKMSAETDSRRTFLSKVTAATIATAGLGTTSGVLVPPAASAVGGMTKVNAKLQAFGLPSVPKIDGLNPLLYLYGKGANRFPLLVTFSHPLDWVVTLPNNNVNGEDGTIQAGDYAKGDTATLFVYTDPGNVKVSNELCIW